MSTHFLVLNDGRISLVLRRACPSHRTRHVSLASALRAASRPSLATSWYERSTEKKVGKQLGAYREQIIWNREVKLLDIFSSLLPQLFLVQVTDRVNWEATHPNVLKTGVFVLRATSLVCLPRAPNACRENKAPIREAPDNPIPRLQENPAFPSIIVAWVGGADADADVDCSGSGACNFSPLSWCCIFTSTHACTVCVCPGRARSSCECSAADGSLRAQVCHTAYPVLRCSSLTLPPLPAGHDKFRQLSVLDRGQRSNLTLVRPLEMSGKRWRRPRLTLSHRIGVAVIMIPSNSSSSSAVYS